MSIDIFEAPLNLNYRGGGGITTPVGGMFSIVIYIAFAMFTYSKFSYVGTDRGDTITSHVTNLLE